MSDEEITMTEAETIRLRLACLSIAGKEAGRREAKADVEKRAGELLRWVLRSIHRPQFVDVRKMPNGTFSVWWGGEILPFSPIEPVQTLSGSYPLVAVVDIPILQLGTDVRGREIDEISHLFKQAHPGLFAIS